MRDKVKYCPWMWTQNLHPFLRKIIRTVLLLVHLTYLQSSLMLSFSPLSPTSNPSLNSINFTCEQYPRLTYSSLHSGKKLNFKSINQNMSFFCSTKASYRTQHLTHNLSARPPDAGDLSGPGPFGFASTALPPPPVLQPRWPPCSPSPCSSWPPHLPPALSFLFTFRLQLNAIFSKRTSETLPI